MSCLNCGGDDNVTYEWTLEPNSNNTTMDQFDWDTFSAIDADNASLTINPFGFLHITEAEPYAFVLTGNASLS